jgi:16S rRNA processing protein RimM
VTPAGKPDWIAVGRIGRAHGVRGEVSVLPLSEVAERYESGSRLFLDQRRDLTLTVASSRPHRRRLLVQFEEIADRTTAETFAGRYLFVPAAAVPPLPEDEYWPFQLIGLEVVTEAGLALGRLREVIHTQANDVWVAEGSEGTEVLVPALKDVVRQVDLEAGRILVRDIPGLTTP